MIYKGEWPKNKAKRNWKQKREEFWHILNKIFLMLSQTSLKIRRRRAEFAFVNSYLMTKRKIKKMPGSIQSNECLNVRIISTRDAFSHGYSQT